MSGADNHNSLIVGGSATPTALKSLPQNPLNLGTHGKSAIFLDGYHLQGLKVLLYGSPFEAFTGCFQT
jgi:hypothetical protein